MLGDAHAHEQDLRQLAERLVEAAGDPEREDVNMLLTAYMSAVRHRREELQERLDRLQMDWAIVWLDAAEAIGVDVAGALRAGLADMGVTPEDLIADIRRTAREAPDGATRAEARRWLTERGLPLDDDDPDEAREGT